MWRITRLSKPRANISKIIVSSTMTNTSISGRRYSTADSTGSLYGSPEIYKFGTISEISTQKKENASFLNIQDTMKIGYISRTIYWKSIDLKGSNMSRMSKEIKGIKYPEYRRFWKKRFSIFDIFKYRTATPKPCDFKVWLVNGSVLPSFSWNGR